MRRARWLARSQSAPSSSHGFTLVEIAVVLLVLALLLGILATFSGGLVAQQRREITRQRLQGVDTALALFVAQYKRLPCPADGALASSASSAGSETAYSSTTGCANNQVRGVVPWRAIGLAEQDITDGWGNRFTYRVASDFAAQGAMNFTRCDPAGTRVANTSVDSVNGYCANPSVSYSSFSPSDWTDPQKVTAGRGLKVQNLSSTAIMDPGLTTSTTPTTGAAYVVVSHGENAQGGYNNQGVVQTGGSVSAGDLERKNFASLEYVVGCASTSTTCTAFLVDDFPAFSQGTGYFDDLVLRPSILAVALKAQTGPRAH